MGYNVMYYGGIIVEFVFLFYQELFYFKILNQFIIFKMMYTMSFKINRKYRIYAYICTTYNTNIICHIYYILNVRF